MLIPEELDTSFRGIVGRILDSLVESGQINDDNAGSEVRTLWWAKVERASVRTAIRKPFPCAIQVLEEALRQESKSASDGVDKIEVAAGEPGAT